MKYLTYILIALVFCSASSQDMRAGFDLLESGNFQQAETFFKVILKDHPKNKTARLCYGRAVGLNGRPEVALSLFSELLKDHKDDFEIKLNYGESLLWNKDFLKARSYFESLIKERPESFAAILSYANSLSNLKDYDNAFTYVNKALEISPGNPNALRSRKYILLGYAYQKQQSQDYDKAEALLVKNLEQMDDDKETLLNLANLYLIKGQLDQAEATYYRLGRLRDSKTLSWNGLALVEHLKGKEKKALSYSRKAYDSLEGTSDGEIIKQTTERYAQALIWNRRFRQARTIIDQCIDRNPNKNWPLALRATLNIYKGNFKKSLHDYNAILVNDSTSFDGNLGKANALKALGRYDEAYEAANITLKIHKNQKDAMKFLNTLDNKFSTKVDNRASRSFDNGDNVAFSSMNKAEFHLSTKLALSGKYNYRYTSNATSGNKARLNDFSMGLSYEFMPNMVLDGGAGLLMARAESTSFTQLLADVSVRISSLKLQTLHLGYKREIQSFNADLLDREIVQNNIYANYDLSTNVNLGLFAQYYYTSQNDGNARNLLFSSLYYNLLQSPTLKAGINYQYISFKEQVGNLYFSPSSFNAGELFVNLVRNESIIEPKEWFYEVTVATGLQYIENNGGQNTYRLQATLGYKFSNRSNVNIFGIRSNIASATAAGFSYSEIGVRFKWQLAN